MPSQPVPRRMSVSGQAGRPSVLQGHKRRLSTSQTVNTDIGDPRVKRYKCMEDDLEVFILRFKQTQEQLSQLINHPPRPYRH
jgi:hypothetical protein